MPEEPASQLVVVEKKKLIIKLFIGIIALIGIPWIIAVLLCNTGQPWISTSFGRFFMGFISNLGAPYFLVTFFINIALLVTAYRQRKVLFMLIAIFLFLPAIAISFLIALFLSGGIIPP
jgi:hypothetical protein